MFKTRHKIELSLLLLLLGGSIYLLFRSTSLVMFSWFKILKMDGIINILRSKLNDIQIPYLILYCMPNMLWISSYLIMIDALKLDYSRNLFWSFIMPFIAVLFEILQIWNIIPGTFDLWDLICLLLPSLLYLRHTLKKKLYETGI